MGGWEPRETITFLFARTWWKPWTWVPVGSVVEREPEWSLADVDLLIASAQFEAGIGSHGHPLDEATSSDADPSNAKGLFRYEAGPRAKVDWAQRAKDLATEDFRKSFPDQSMAGYFFPVRKVWRS